MVCQRCAGPDARETVLQNTTTVGKLCQLCIDDIKSGAPLEKVPGCDRCGTTLAITKELLLSNPKRKVKVCTSCRTALDQGAGMTYYKPHVRPSKLKKILAKLDSGEADTKSAEYEMQQQYQKHAIAAQQPFPAAWRKPS